MDLALLDRDVGAVERSHAAVLLADGTGSQSGRTHLGR
jgi:hypothetical protein